MPEFTKEILFLTRPAGELYLEGKDTERHSELLHGCVS
jgi:hypothetical protein